MKQLARPLVQYLIIAVLGMLAYSNTFHVPFLFDDQTSIVENPVITDLGRFLSGDGLAYNARRVVGYFSFALNYRLGGLNVVGYHTVNLAIHIVTACLVASLVRLILKSPLFRSAAEPAGEGSGPQPIDLVPLLAALLFVAHPIQTQAVTYIVQRLASLATLFYLLSLHSYTRGRLVQLAAAAPQRGGARGRAPLHFAAALVAGGLALATKEIAFTLPVVVLLFELCFFSRRRSTKPAILLGLLVVIAAGIMLAAPQPLGELISDVSARLRLQTEMPRWHYFVTQCAVIVTYMRLLLFPAGQNLDYDYPVYTSLLQPRPLASSLLLLLLFAVAVYLYLQDRRAAQTGALPRPERRLMAFGLFWFFLTLSIESSLIPIEDLIFEHRMYLPSVGIFIAVAGVAALAARRAPRAVALAACLALLLFAGTTWSRNLTWGDAVTFWGDVVRKAPAKARAHLNLGVALEAKERSGEAVAAFTRALSLRPGYRQAYCDLGAAYNSLEAFDQAIAVLQEGLSQFPGDPDLHNNIGISFAAKGSPETAVPFFEAAVRLAPGVEKYRLNLAMARQETRP